MNYDYINRVYLTGWDFSSKTRQGTCGVGRIIAMSGCFTLPQLKMGYVKTSMVHGVVAFFGLEQGIYSEIVRS